VLGARDFIHQMWSHDKSAAKKTVSEKFHSNRNSDRPLTVKGAALSSVRFGVYRQVVLPVSHDGYVDGEEDRFCSSTGTVESSQ
jgi:hypothetical protein